MKGSKLFKNVRLKGQKELVSILVEDGIFKKIAADIPQEKTVGCEEVDLNGQLVVPPYVDPHLHLDYVFTASLGEENGSGTLFEGIQRWSESKGNDCCTDEGTYLQWNKKRDAAWCSGYPNTY